MVAAVGAAITPPAAVDTLAAAAEELLGPARRGLPLGGPPPRAALGPLVRAVDAVAVAVAGPQGRHAHRVVALEGPGAAGGQRAAVLVRAVLAVVLAVADEGGGDAVATAAAELTGGARLGRCGVTGGIRKGNTVRE